MHLYKLLKESIALNSLKDLFTPIFYDIKDLVIKYNDSDDESLYSDILEDIINKLNEVVDILNSLGYTYEPEQVPDVDEEVFRANLESYKEQLFYLLHNFEEDLLNQFNVQTKYILNLIEVHRPNYIEEGEILYDEQSDN